MTCHNLPVLHVQIRPTVDDIMLDKTVQRAVFKYSFHTFFSRVVRTTVTHVMHMEEAVTNVDLITIYSVLARSQTPTAFVACSMKLA